MRRLAIFLAILAVIGCKPTVASANPEAAKALETQTCIRALEVQLRSPSTLQVLEIHSEPGTVSIKYDAANAYGTPVRSTIGCDFSAMAADEITGIAVADELTQITKITEIRVNRKPLGPIEFFHVTDKMMTDAGDKVMRMLQYESTH